LVRTTETCYPWFTRQVNTIFETPRKKYRIPQNRGWECFRARFKEPCATRALHTTTMIPLITRLALASRTCRAHQVTKIKTTQRSFTRQSMSPLAPLGVDAALEAANDASFDPKPKIFSEFALADRVGIVSGGNRGLGLEMALALCEAGARAIYCLGVSDHPSDEWIKTKDFVERLGTESRLEYVKVDVRNQKEVWEISERIGEKEKRMDMCVAAAGVLKSARDCLTYPAEEFEEVMDVNANGVLYTAQGAGQQMRKFGNGGSIILVASKSGSFANKVSSKKLCVRSF
jgi:hypothetical protein